MDMFRTAWTRLYGDPPTRRPSVAEVQAAERQRAAEERRRDREELALRLAQGAGSYFPSSARSRADEVLLGYDEWSSSNYGDRR